MCASAQDVAHQQRWFATSAACNVEAMTRSAAPGNRLNKNGVGGIADGQLLCRETALDVAGAGERQRGPHDGELLQQEIDAHPYPLGRAADDATARSGLV